MTCRNCKHEIAPSEIKCPICGAENPFGIEHAKNMKKHEAAFSKTEKDVAASTGMVIAVGTRAAILIVLLIGILLMAEIGNRNYEDPHPEIEVQEDAVKNAAVYAEQMDDLLKNGQYFDFMCFVFAHDIAMVDAPEYDGLFPIRSVANDYYQCIRGLEEMILRSTDPEYFDGLDTDISNFCMYLESFLTNAENMKSRKQKEEYPRYMDEMLQEMKAALKTYLAMDDAALEEFLEQSKAQKAVELERILRHE